LLNIDREIYLRAYYTLSPAGRSATPSDGILRANGKEKAARMETFEPQQVKLQTGLVRPG
jgi:hypothetical protein